MIRGIGVALGLVMLVGCGDSKSSTPVSGIEGIHAVAVNDRYIFVADGKLLRRVARP